MQLVYEKEKRLRMMMKMHGLGDTAYWLVMYSWFLLLYMAYMFIFVFFGSIIGLNMFTKNSYGERQAGQGGDHIVHCLRVFFFLAGGHALLPHLWGEVGATGCCTGCLCWCMKRDVPA